MEKDAAVNMIQLLMIGGSAGSLEVLLEVMPQIKDNISFAIVIVLHRKRGQDNLLAELFATKTNLPVKELEEKEEICNGTIYFAPADYHLLIEKDRTFSLDFSEKVNYSRPSIDVALQSAADVYGRNLAALILSGANADGARGLRYMSDRGGVALVQDPETAAVAYMPAYAATLVKGVVRLKPGQIAGYINSITGENVQ